MADGFVRARLTRTATRAAARRRLGSSAAPRRRAVPRLVDLSQEIYQGMGVYPGHLKTVVWDHATHEETRQALRGRVLVPLAGADDVRPRADARRRASATSTRAEDAPSIDEMPLDTFYGPALCIDVSHVEPPDYVTVGRSRAGARGRGPGAGARATRCCCAPGRFDRYGGTPEYTSRYTGPRRGRRPSGCASAA